MICMWGKVRRACICAELSASSLSCRKAEGIVILLSEKILR